MLTDDCRTVNRHPLPVSWNAKDTDFLGSGAV